jgi:hypothetical protein
MKKLFESESKAEAWQKYFALKQETCEKEEDSEKSRYERREKIIS